LISREEYAQWVEWAKNNYTNIPGILVSNYDAWECRAMLGRYLYVAKQYGAAILILETIVDVKYDEGEGDDQYNPTGLEMKAWSLQWLSLAILFEKNDKVLALKYMKKALRLADLSTAYFHFVVRGELWLNCLLLKAKLGRKIQAVGETHARLSRLVVEDGLSNSYYFFGYAFLGQMAMEEQKPQLALDLFKKGLTAYNLEETDKELLIQTEACADPGDAFKMLWQLVDEPYRLWDEPLNWEGSEET